MGEIDEMIATKVEAAVNAALEPFMERQGLFMKPLERIAYRDEPTFSCHQVAKDLNLNYQEVLDLWRNGDVPVYGKAHRLKKSDVINALRHYRGGEDGQ